MTLRISSIELRLLEWGMRNENPCVRTGDLQRLFGLDVDKERKTLSRMANRGIIARVRRGFYLLPNSIPDVVGWSPGEARALSALMKDRGGRYQICGPNTFHRYGWDEQIPNRTYAYNNRISGDRSVGKVELTLIRVADCRLGDTEIVKTADGFELIFSSRVRSLIDAVYEWSRFNSLPQAFVWIRDDLLASRVHVVDLVNTAIHFGNQSTLRRLGYLFEELSNQQDLPVHIIGRLEKAIHATSSTIAWIPTSPKRGRVSKRWGIVVNGTLPAAS